jgi:ribosomal protein L24E
MRQIGVAIAFIVMLSGCEVSPGHGNTFSSSINRTGGQLYVTTPNSILHFINAENTV